MKPPAFQFYPDDFVAGTVDMTTHQIGAYMLLLCYQWSKGYVPDDDEKIRHIIREQNGFPLEAIRVKFKSKRGKLFNVRLEHERRKQVEYRQKQAINGKKGGRPEKPKLNPSLSFGLSQTEAKKSSPSPSSISNGNGSLSPANRISMEQELNRVIKELDNRKLADYPRESQTYNRIKQLLTRRDELRRILGVVA